MKEKELKKEVADTLEIVSKHIRESKFDYDLEDLEGLLDQAVAYYALYKLEKTHPTGRTDKPIGYYRNTLRRK